MYLHLRKNKPTITDKFDAQIDFVLKNSIYENHTDGKYTTYKRKRKVKNVHIIFLLLKFKHYNVKHTDKIKIYLSITHKRTKFNASSTNILLFQYYISSFILHSIIRDNKIFKPL